MEPLGGWELCLVNFLVSLKDNKPSTTQRERRINLSRTHSKESAAGFVDLGPNFPILVLPSLQAMPVCFSLWPGPMFELFTAKCKSIARGCQE